MLLATNILHIHVCMAKKYDSLTLTIAIKCYILNVRFFQRTCGSEHKNYTHTKCLVGLPFTQYAMLLYVLLLQKIYNPPPISPTTLLLAKILLMIVILLCVPVPEYMCTELAPSPSLLLYMLSRNVLLLIIML